ncbi:MAG: BrnA antitoxin family protein [Methylobacillus sp.]|jgi:uncharacterized protein (DUF4415 family)|nr:BrnA antitoxin family protein [Methylobacillus sp.]
MSALSKEDHAFNALVATPDSEIDGGDKLKSAARGQPYKSAKRQIAVRMDADVLEWVKLQGKKGYHTRINAILREAMLRSAAHKP